jgi:hypothetical protein
MARRRPPRAACGVIHELLDSLPRFAGPADIPIDDGLYFFYERGESTRHTSGARVVRVGNHPRSAGRLKARLRDHYRESRGAKNGSVFRRYLGGALLRRSDADSPCLAPSPGAGHWERQNESTCHACAGVEHLVSSTLREQFFLRALRVTDTQERNRLEGLLIATIAACPICRPSRAWLGSFAYPELVRQTGVWNTEFVGGPLMNENDLSRFRELVGESRGRMPQTDDLSRTLLVIPCSGGKAGHRELGLPIVSLSDFVDESSQRLLEEGRELAFQRPGTKLDRGSPLRPALEYYSGQPYKTEGVRDALVAAIMRGLHCVIVSGGYGVVRAEEPIHNYNAHLGTQTRTVWLHRLPNILNNYVDRQGLESSIVLLSRQYAACVPTLTSDEYRFVPQFSKAKDSGSPMQVVPKQIGEELSRLLAQLT